MTDPAEGPPKRSDHLAALKMHVDLANGEKQAIWTRHATMLVGNTIIAGARSGHDGVLLNILGLLLCGAWAWMTWVGWDEFHKSLRAGAAVPVEPTLNPFCGIFEPTSLGPHIHRRQQGCCHLCADLPVWPLPRLGRTKGHTSVCAAK